MADLLKNISRAKKPLPCDYEELQKYWFRLDECKVVLTGMGKAHLLKKGKLLSKLVDGFNRTMQSEFKMKYGNPAKWTFDCIMEHVNSEIQFLHRKKLHNDDHAIDKMDESTSSTKQQKRSRDTHFNSVETKTTLDQQEDKDGAKTNKCIFHKNASHKLADCFKWKKLSVQERKSRCRNKGLCYRCLSKHLFKNCPSKENCEICGYSHHTTLHFNVKEKPTPRNDEAEETQPKSTIQANTTAALQHIDLMALKRRVPIMSLTALSKRTKKEIPFYAFLDTGAERNMASKELALELGIWNPKGKTTLRGMTGEKQVESLTTSLNLKTQNGGVVCFKEVIFAKDLDFPFSDNIPSREELLE